RWAQGPDAVPGPPGAMQRGVDGQASKQGRPEPASGRPAVRRGQVGGHDPQQQHHADGRQQQPGGSSGDQLDRQPGEGHASGGHGQAAAEPEGAAGQRDEAGQGEGGGVGGGGGGA